MYSKLMFLTSDEDNIVYGNAYTTVIIKKNDWLNKKIDNIGITVLEQFDTRSQFGCLTNQYKKLLDYVMMLPADKLKIIRDAVKKKENQ